VIPVAPAACDVNTFVLLPLGAEVIVDMIAFLSIQIQNYQGYVGCKLLVSFSSFLLGMRVHIIHLPSFNGSLSLVTNQMMKWASGRWNLRSNKMDGHNWL
jgi:hypothetical protein